MSKFDMSIQEKLLSAPASMVAVTILVVNTAPRLDIMAEHMEIQAWHDKAHDFLFALYSQPLSPQRASCPVRSNTRCR